MRTRGQKLKEAVVRSGVLRPHRAVIIGFSGGPDSLALLALLDALREEWDLRLFAIHVNHGLRPEASREAKHAAELASHFTCTYIEREASVSETASEKKIGIEEAGREERYRIFREIASACRRETGREVLIALGHHADDQAETVLFRLIRGTGIHGLAGIPAVREDAGGAMIIRPLLDIHRAEIEDYIEELGLEPNHDTSNDSDDYTRNRIRHELLPLLEREYNPSVREALVRLAASASEEDARAEAAAKEELTRREERRETETGETAVKLEDFENLPAGCQYRIVVLLLKQLGLEDRIRRSLAEELLAVMTSRNPSARMRLPKGWEAVRRYDELILRFAEVSDESDESDDSDDSVDSAAPLTLRMKRLTDEEWEKCCGEYPAGSCAVLDADLLGDPEDIVLRTRQDGDRIALAVGTKRLQDLLVDSKVPREEREELLLAARGREILWIPGPPAFERARQVDLKCAAAEEKVFGEGAARFFARGRYTKQYRLSPETTHVLVLTLEFLN